MSDHPFKKVLHACGSTGALCGEPLYLMPMNFAPAAYFGRVLKPGCEWCVECLRLSREGKDAK